MYKRILVPLDGSKTAETILPQVQILLKQENAEVLLFHVIQFIPPPDGYFASVLPELRKDGENYLNEVADRLKKDGVNVRTILEEGLIATHILRIAQKEKVSLIAMTTHGRTGLSRWVFGSVAEKVLHASPVPVLMLRSFQLSNKGALVPATEAPLSLDNIMFPTDGSETSEMAIPHVRDFAKMYGARVTLLHTVETGQQDDHATIFKNPTKVLQESGVNLTTLTKEGDAASEIVEAARALPFDLIAMATHGRSGVTRWLFGSVTEKVVRSTSLPVLVIPCGAKTAE